jgi:hypothetical protein
VLMQARAAAVIATADALVPHSCANGWVRVSGHCMKQLQLLISVWLYSRKLGMSLFP